jgi:hypothetical protein
MIANLPRWSEFFDGAQRNQGEPFVVSAACRERNQWDDQRCE